VRGAEGHPAATGPAAVAAAIGSPDPAPPELAPRAVVHPAPPAPPVPSRTGPDPSPPAARPATVPQLVAPAGLPAVPQRSPALTAPAVPFPAAAADRRTRRAEPPGRTVQVHIGRIEVSAPPRPEAGPERARRRGPDLTLEKYLGGAEARHE
jgi:hypothetical protein